MIINKNRFPGGKLKCVTLSYDDGRIQDIRLAEMFRKYGLKCTFNLNGSNYADGNTRENGVNIDKFGEVYDGFEIACHGYTHPSYKMLDNAQVTYDIIKDRAFFEKLLKKPVRGFALPMGSYNEDTVDILKQCGFLYSRTVDSTKSFDMPENFLIWKPTFKHDHPGLVDIANRFINEKHWEARMRLLFVWGHSYELDEDSNRWETMEEFCKIVGGRDDIWYATNIDICLYMQALDRLVVSVDGTSVFNPTNLSVWVTVGNPWGEAVEIKPGETVCFE